MTQRITKVEPFGRGGTRLRLYLDPGEPLEITLEAFERGRIGVGDELSSERRRALLDLDAEVRVREAALSLISYRARTRRELERRLRQKGFTPERIETCLDRLVERGLVDDASVAAAFVRDRLRHRPRGRTRLVQELRQKGVAGDVAGSVVDGVFSAEAVSDGALAGEVAAGWVDRQGRVLLEALANGERTAERERAVRRLRGYLTRRGFGGAALGDAVAGAVALAAARVRSD